MPKHIEDIIVPERKRSIRDIPIPEGRRRAERYEIPSVSRENHSFNNSSHDNFNLSPGEGNAVGKKSKNKWMVAGISLLILIFAILSVFDGATLAYIPKSQAVSFDNNSYTAHQAGESELLFSVIKLSGEKGLEISASGEKAVERKASGTIIIYNASVTDQKLRATTRFETPDGKIYQVPDTIVVPGKKIISGNEKLGTLEVVVYAEHLGKEFNIDLTDFTLPGLKGTPLFSLLYARSKTDMSGGFSGVEKMVKNEDEMRVRAQLEAILKEELISEAKAQVPEDFILLPSLSLVTFKNLPQTNSASENDVTMNMRADLSGVMFKRSDLSRRLARDRVTIAAGESFDIVEMDSLNFTFANGTPVAPLSSNEIKFSVKGEAVVVWRIDEVALKADLMGKSKRDIPSILNNYPTIVEATATIRPFWKSSFPKDSAGISLKKLLVK